MIQETDGTTVAPPERRRAYVRPALMAYGNVREFTRGVGGSKADKGDFFKSA